ncbi:hypothetical protein CTI32_14590 (plasmid) [Enterococcus faecium]|nr:hypothetical protein CTI32_14515 [Enterococcus faecium]AYA35565.1 hypothetical protein CTI32_14590 [Enterococcus faecium]
MCCGNSILQKGLPFFYLHKIFYTLENSQKVILAIYLIVILSIILFLVWFIFSGNAINYKPFYGPTTI